MADCSATFDRSCAHWSEAKRAEMEAFYALASKDYDELAQAFGWWDFLRGRQARAGGRSLRLLDVACGSGKFPTALKSHGPAGGEEIEPITYDLLDPSSFSLEEAAAILEPPFFEGVRFNTTLQDLPPVEPYDVVWATHALYALPGRELAAGMAAFGRAMGEGGEGFIAHATKNSHYLRFDALFREAFRKQGSEPYTSAEEVEAAAIAAGLHVERQTLEYCATSKDGAAVEGYLQRCVFDDTETLDDMLAHTVTGSYLRDCQNGDEWQFAQEVALLRLRAA
jgi:SAM-dependent methyltransferase